MALVTRDAGFTYAELCASADGLARRLLRSGKQGRVGIWCDSTPEFFIALLAIWRAGGVAVPLDSRDRTERSDEIIALSQLDHVLAKEGLELPLALRQTPRIAFDHEKPSADGGGEQLVFPSADALAAILFTSGSTGLSKGVMLSYRSILGNAASMASALGLTPADRLLINIPFQLTSAIGHFLACLATGATCIALNEFAFGPELSRNLKRHAATAFGGAPIQLARIVDYLDTPEGANVGRDLPLRLAMSSGDALPVATIQKWRRCRPEFDIFTVYGLTELGARFCVLDPKFLSSKAGSVGKPIEGLAMRLHGEDGAPIEEPNIVGEVHAQGDFLMDGYFGDASATRTTLSEKGLATGDLGYVDEDGFLFLIGRSDDVFKSSGVKVSAKHVENRLWALNLFEDVVVWPVPHSEFGLLPYAFFVPRAGKPFERSLVTERLKDEISSVEIPKRFVQVDRIPRLANGKIQRSEMQKLAESLKA